MLTSAVRDAGQVRILSLDPEDALKVAAVQAVDATPESLLMLDSPVAESGADGTGAGAATLFLHTGARCGARMPATACGSGQGPAFLGQGRAAALGGGACDGGSRGICCQM